jgi:putative ABC transport system permease protein
LFDLRRADVFDDISAVWPISANLTETDEPERVETALVDANYFSTLGIGAEVGRVFGRSDAQPGIAEVAVISHALWKRRFGGDPSVLGTRIRIDNDMYSIVGVAPASFRHPGRGTETDVEVWAPAGWLASPFSPQPIRRAYLLQGGLGRLKAGLTVEAAQQRVDALAERLRREYPAD